MADGSPCSHRLGAVGHDWHPHRLLADLFALALEISRGSCGCASYCFAAYCAGILYVDSAGFAKSARPLVGIVHRPPARFYLRRPCRRIFVIQFAVRGAAIRCIIWSRRSPVVASCGIPWRFAAAGFSPCRSSPLKSGPGHRSCA